MGTNGFNFEWDNVGEGSLFFNMFEQSLFDRSNILHTPPSMYQVVLLNDDQTPMDFVTFVLQTYFYKSLDEANEITLKIHQDEMAVCGTFTRDVAESKIMQIIEFSRQNRHPLKCVMQREQEYVVKKS